MEEYENAEEQEEQEKQVDLRKYQGLLKQIYAVALQAGIPKNNVVNSKKEWLIKRVSGARAENNPIDLAVDFIYGKLGLWVNSGFTFVVDGGDANSRVRVDIGYAILMNAIIKRCCTFSPGNDGIARVVAFPEIVSACMDYNLITEMTRMLDEYSFLFISEVDYDSKVYFNTNRRLPSVMNTAIRRRINSGKLTIFSVRGKLDSLEPGRRGIDVEGLQLSDVLGTEFEDIVRLVEHKRSAVYEHEGFCRIAL